MEDRLPCALACVDDDTVIGQPLARSDIRNEVEHPLVLVGRKLSDLVEAGDVPLGQNEEMNSRLRIDISDRNEALGLRNMLALARGLMVEPAVLLIDEPTAGLAPRYESAVWDHVLAVRDTGVAVVVVEQNTRRTLGNADWAYLLTLGQVRVEGTGADLLRNEEVVELYVGGATRSAETPTTEEATGDTPGAEE